MIEIDGSQGEGGGQIVRSSLALSAVTGTPFRLSNIRAGRNKPGLQRQHLASVHAATEICEAEVTGDELGSFALAFTPGKIRSGDYTFAVGTAGSTTLIAQTVLPALMLAAYPSSVSFGGGTHNPFAPPYDFLQNCFLPQLEKAGPKVETEIQNYGFYPAGGGVFEMKIQPAEKLSGFELLDRGADAATPKVTAIVSSLPAHVGERECDTIRRKFGWDEKCCEVYEVAEPTGPGNVVMVELAYPNVTEMFSGFGKVGVRAEQIARNVARDVKAYLNGDTPVGEYLADQLMMPMGLAAAQGQQSAFRTHELSLHSKTHIDILKTFLSIRIDVEEAGNERIVRFAPD